jgi:hypothetical protein
MDSNLLILGLVAVMAATALNLFLTAKLAARIRKLYAEEVLTVPIDKPIPHFEGRRWGDGSRIVAADLRREPSVLVFLSAHCPACRGKVAELTDILPGTRSAGVALWIVQIDEIFELIRETPLLSHLLVLDDSSLKALNPINAAPAYIFVGAGGMVEASGYLGDEDWRSFVKQMGDSAPDDRV